jgi:hypothetical protein
MKRITDTPNISKEMQAIYRQLRDSNGNFEAILPLLDKFILKYPYYTEAIIFKARALMAVGRNAEAHKYIKMVTRIDKWRLNGRFDEAELLLEKKKKEVSLDIYVGAVKAYATELKEGIDSYLICCNHESQDKIRELTQKALTEFFAQGTENDSFKKLLDDLIKIKNKIEHYKNV